MMSITCSRLSLILLLQTQQPLRLTGLLSAPLLRSSSDAVGGGCCRFGLGFHLRLVLLLVLRADPGGDLAAQGGVHAQEQHMLGGNRAVLLLYMVAPTPAWGCEILLLELPTDLTMEEEEV